MPKAGPAKKGPVKKAAPAKKAERLEAGDRAPAFSLPDQDGRKVSLKEFAGSPLVVYFYPADDTPGCTKEACQFNDNLHAFNRAGVSVVGISPDDAASHRAFRAKYGLRLPLLSDPGHTTMERYGAWGEKTLYGRKSVGVIRSTFLVGSDGRVARAWYGVRADGHAAKVLEEAAALRN
jgi:peroxiredoxin Q/BCP